MDAEQLDVTVAPSTNGDSRAKLFSIGEIADLTGIGTDTIRAWERRYGRPKPVRLPSGHRRYTSDMVRWVRRCAEALANGHRTSAVVTLDESALDQLLLAGRLTSSGDPRVDRLLAAIGERKFATFAQELDALAAKTAPVELLDQLLSPLLHGIGRAWADGLVGIRHEHRVVAIVGDLLRRLCEPGGSTLRRPGVLLATPQEERHGLGLWMASYLCTTHHVEPTLLGTDLPIEEIIAAAHEEKPQAVALSVSVVCTRRDCDAHLRDLRQRLPPATHLIVGGAGIAHNRRPMRGVSLMRDFAAFDRWLVERR